MDKPTAAARQVMTVEETAELLGISRNAAYEAVKLQQIPSIRIGRCIRVPIAAYERMLSGAGSVKVTRP